MIQYFEKYLTESYFFCWFSEIPLQILFRCFSYLKSFVYSRLCVHSVCEWCKRAIGVMCMNKPSIGIAMRMLVVTMGELECLYILCS